MQSETVRKVLDNELKKGDVLGVARFAAIRAATTAPLLLLGSQSLSRHVVAVNFTVATTHIDIEIVIESAGGFVTSSHSNAAALVAALTIYDMCKAVDHSMVIEDVASTR